MKEFLKGLVASPKFQVLVAGAVMVTLTQLTAHFGVVLDPSIADNISKAIIGLAGAFVLGKTVIETVKEQKKPDEQI